MNYADWIASKKAEAFNAGIDPAKFSIPPEQIWRVAQQHARKNCRAEIVEILEKRIAILSTSDKEFDIAWSAALRSVMHLLRLQDR